MEGEAATSFVAGPPSVECGIRAPAGSTETCGRRGGPWASLETRCTQDMAYQRGFAAPCLTHEIPQPDGEEQQSQDESEGDAVEALPARDDLFEPCEIPDKWLRLNIQCPVFSFHDVDDGAIDHTGGRKNGARNRLESPAIEFMNGDIARKESLGDFGVAFEVLPSDYAGMDRALATCRAAGADVILPVPIISFDLSVSTDWLDRDRKNIHVAVRMLAKSRRDSMTQCRCVHFQRPTTILDAAIRPREHAFRPSRRVVQI